MMTGRQFDAENFVQAAGDAIIAAGADSFEPQPDRLGDDVLAAIKEDFENWMSSMGLCAQCADLYRASRLSMAAAKLLPGWTPSPTPEPTDGRHASKSAAAGGK